MYYQRRQLTARTPARTPAAKEVTVTLAPPAYAVRQAAGLGIPTPGGLLQSLLGVGLGAVGGGVMIAAFPQPAKFTGALVAFMFGGLAATTSPIGTFAQEFGAGMLSGSATWLVLDATGQLAPPSSTTGT